MVVSSEKFQFLATDQRQEWQYRQPAEDLETEDSTMPDSDLYLNGTGALVPSLLWHFLHQFFSGSFSSQLK